MTELDLRHSLIPDELIEDLVKTMPQHKGPDLQEDRDVAKYDYVTFMNKLIDEEHAAKSQANGHGNL